jgi:pyocin large subunit-like protein
VSFTALNWAWEQHCPTGFAKSVLVYLANCASQHGGSCWPSVPKIARCIQHKEDTVRKAIRQLQDVGLVEVETRSAANGCRQSNLYRLAISFSDTVPEAGVVKEAPHAEFEGWNPPTSGTAPPTISGGNPSLEPKEESKKERCSLRSQGEPDLFSSSGQVIEQHIEPDTERRCANPADTVIDAWNHMATENDLPTIRLMTPTRRRSLATRIAEVGLDSMLAAIVAVAGSAFCRGASESGWRADFDFLLQPKSLIRVLEGRYSRGKTPKEGKYDYLTRMIQMEADGIGTEVAF